MKRAAGQPAKATPGIASGDVRVGVYVRRSTDDEHQPYSIAAQDARLAAYIDAQPCWTISTPSEWWSGRPPFGYHADTVAQALVPDIAEAAMVRLIFDLYTRDRLGARIIAALRLRR
jgi:hypothetical protein